MIAYIAASILSAAVFLGSWAYMITKRNDQLLSDRIDRFFSHSNLTTTLSSQTFYNEPSVLQTSKASSKKEESIDTAIKKAQSRLGPLPIIAGIALVLASLWHILQPGFFLLKFLFTFLDLFIGSWFYRSHVRRKRLRLLELDLPNAIDLLIVCMEAGMSLNSALVRVAEEMRGSPLSDELLVTFQELNLGMPLEYALKRLSERAKIEDVHSLVMVMLQSEKIGMSLGDALRNHARTLRETIRMRTREKIQKMPVKLLFPLVLCIMPALFTVLLAPSLIAIAKAFVKIGTNQ